MEKIEIPTTKRPGKALFNIIMVAGLLAIASFFAKAIIQEFSWLMLGGLIVFGGVGVFMLFELSNLFHNNVKVVAEVTKPGRVKIYCQSGSGKIFNEMEELNTKIIAKMYILKKKNTKGLNTDLSIEYVIKKSTKEETEELDIFPGDVFSSTEEDLTKLFVFIQQQNPSMVIGY